MTIDAQDAASTAPLPADLPRPVTDPRALSPDHLMLKCVEREGGRPRDLKKILETIRHEYPEVAGRYEFTNHNRYLWKRVVESCWVRWVELRGESRDGPQRGYVLTGMGEARLKHYWSVQVISPYLRRVEASHGREVAAELRRRLFP